MDFRKKHYILDFFLMQSKQSNQSIYDATKKLFTDANNFKCSLNLTVVGVHYMKQYCFI